MIFNRLWKKVTPKGSGAVTSTYYYLRDAQGNEMCRYVKYTNTSSQLMYVVQEHSIYGSSRVGVDGRKDTLYKAGSYSPAWGGVGTSLRDLGSKSFELANHLGNVLVTVSDKPVYKVSGGTVYFNAEVYSISDYYPFGSIMPGRSFNGTSYRYGMGGQEKDDEISGNGNSIGFTERMYDPRLVRWKSPDGASNLYPGLSPYAYIGNSPNFLVEKDGHIIGTLIGAVIGGYRAHKAGTSVWKGVGKGAAAGAVADLTAAAIIVSGGAATPLLIAAAGAGAGLTGNLADQLMDDRPGVSGKELAISTVLGGGLGYAGGKLAPVISKYLSKAIGSRSISVGPVIELSNADDINNAFKANMMAQGVEESAIIAPWKPGFVKKYTTNAAEGGFVRFYGKNNPNGDGDWIMKMDDVVDDAGNMLPFDDIRNKFAIPNEISGYKKVTVGKGVELQKGEANGGGGFEGGGTQYQITGGKENVVYE